MLDYLKSMEFKLEDIAKLFDQNADKLAFYRLGKLVESLKNEIKRLEE